MFKFKTLVHTLISISLAIPPFALAEDNAPTTGSAEQRRIVEREQVQDKCYPYHQGLANATTAQNEKTKEEFKKLVANCESGLSGSCIGDYRAAMTELTATCNVTGATSPSPPASAAKNFPACTYNYLRCNRCAVSPPASDDVATFGCTEEGGEAESIRGDDPPGGGSGLMKSCPWKLSSDQQKKYNEEYKETLKRIEELEKKLEEQQKNSNQEMATEENKAEELQTQMKDKTNEYENRLNEIKKEEQANSENIKAQIEQINAGIRADDDKLRELEAQEERAARSLEETKRQIELNCHAAASNSVAKEQANRLAKLAGKAPTRKRSKNLFKQIGISDRKAWQRQANKYMKWCRQSRPTLASIESADSAYKQAKQEAVKRRKTINDEKAAKYRSLEAMSNDRGCSGMVAGIGQKTSGPGEESKECKMLNQARRDAEVATNNYNRDMNDLATKARKAEARAAEARMRQQMQGMMMPGANGQGGQAGLQQQINDERRRLDALKAAMNEADVANGRSPADAEALRKLDAAYAKFETAATRLVGCKMSACGAGTECAQAKGFLKAIGVTQIPIVDSDGDGQDDMVSLDDIESGPSGSGITPSSTTSGGASGTREGQRTGPQ